MRSEGGFRHREAFREAARARLRSLWAVFALLAGAFLFVIEAASRT